MAWVEGSFMNGMDMGSLCPVWDGLGCSFLHEWCGHGVGWLGLKGPSRMVWTWAACVQRGMAWVVGSFTDGVELGM